MLAFPGMLVSAATQAGMKVPANPDEFDANEFPHFYVFCEVQLGRRMHPGAHWTNAEVVAKIPDDKIKSVTFGELVNLGFQA